MKRIKKQAGSAIVLAVMISLVLVGCGGRAAKTESSYRNTSYSTAADYGAGAEIAMEAEVDEDFDVDEVALGARTETAVGSENQTDFGKKIVWNGYLRIESTDYEKTLQEMQQLFSRYQVQVESSEEYDGSSWYTGGSASSRVMSWQVRIASEHFQDFFEEAGTLSGQIRSKSTSSSDKTKQYNDTAIRIESLTIQQENLMEMMKKAQSIEDMLAIEDRLAEVRSELRILSDTNAQIDYDTAWSSITVELQEVHVYQKENISYGQRLRQAAENSLLEFVEALGDFGVAILYAVPYLLMLAVLIVIILRLHRKRKNRKALKKSVKEEET